MRFFSLDERGWVKNDQFRINILRSISPPVHMHHKKKIALEIATKIASNFLLLAVLFVFLFFFHAMNFVHVVFIVIGINFMKYMEAFKPMLTLALKNTEEYQVSQFTLCYPTDYGRTV